MGKEPFVSKVARKLLNNKKEDVSCTALWKEQENVFGVIMSMAFTDNNAARTQLSTALKDIAEDDVVQAVKKLESIHKYCETDADKASWLFFMGLAYEKGGDFDSAANFWVEAVAYEQPYPLLYLKLAGQAYQDAMFSMASDLYKKALKSLNGVSVNAPAANEGLNRTYYIQAKLRLADCQIMMHCYDDAEKTLKEADKLCSPDESAAFWCMLNALKKESDKLEKNLAILKEKRPAAYESTKKLAEQILDGTNPHFFKKEVPQEQMNAFWDWFEQGEKDMVLLLAGVQENRIKAVEMIQEKLQELFPFVEREIELGILTQSSKCEIEVSDFHMISLREGLKMLFDCQPESQREHWEWKVLSDD